MFYLLVLGLLGAVAAGGHHLAARLAGVRGLRFLSLRAREEAFTSSRRRRILVRAAGPLAAYLVLVALNAVLITRGSELTARVLVAPTSPADRAGLRDGDRVIAVRDEAVRDFEQLREQVQRHKAGGLPLTVERGSEVLTLEVTPDADGMIGIRPTGERSPLPASAVLGAGVMPVEHFARNVQVLWGIAVGTAPENVYVTGSTALMGDGSISSGLWMALVLATTGSLVWPLLLLHALAAALVGERGRVAAGPQALPGGA